MLRSVGARAGTWTRSLSVTRVRNTPTSRFATVLGNGNGERGSTSNSNSNSNSNNSNRNEGNVTVKHWSDLATGLRPLIQAALATDSTPLASTTASSSDTVGRDHSIPRSGDVMYSFPGVPKSSSAFQQHVLEIQHVTAMCRGLTLYAPLLQLEDPNFHPWADLLPLHPDWAEDITRAPGTRWCAHIMEGCVQAVSRVHALISQRSLQELHPLVTPELYSRLQERFAEFDETQVSTSMSLAQVSEPSIVNVRMYNPINLELAEQTDDVMDSEWLFNDDGKCWSEIGFFDVMRHYRTPWLAPPLVRARITVALRLREHFSITHPQGGLLGGSLNERTNSVEVTLDRVGKHVSTPRESSSSFTWSKYRIAMITGLD